MRYGVLVSAMLAVTYLAFAQNAEESAACSDYCVTGGKNAMNPAPLLAKPEFEAQFGESEEELEQKAKATLTERYVRYCAQSEEKQPGNLFWCKDKCIDKSGGLSAKIINRSQAEKFAAFIDERQDACKTLGFLVGK